jgi:Cd2+/Zn2+-exporting ATPase
MSDSCCHGACNTSPVVAPSPSPGPRGHVWRLGGSAAAIGAGLLASSAGHDTIALVSYVTAIAASIVPPARRAARSLRAKVLDINVLMIVAVVGAAALGDWLESATVLWLFGVAQWLESQSMQRARRAIRSLLTLAPTEALVRRAGADHRVDVATVEPGEIVIVRPGERIPLDAAVLMGASEVNQAPITGESMPVSKRPGDEVLAGSINGAGVLELETLRPASDSTLARIARLVEQAQTRRAPIQTFVDRFARRYTPTVIGLAVAVAVLPPLFGAADAASFSTWLYRALALLVVACPCALVISTPVSIVSALTAAARAGVLVKGGAHLERLGSIACVAFDKTGTLTSGDITVTDVFALDGGSPQGVLSVAAALESRSEHPIGRAIVTRALDHGVVVAPGRDYRALPGLGAEAHVGEWPAIVGNHRLFEERQLCTPSLHDHLDRMTGTGSTSVLVGHAGAAVGVISLADELRAESRETVNALRAQGVKHVVLLSGDNAQNVEAAGAISGVDETHAELLPEDKASFVARLRAAHGSIAMVGDGINDAPALAAADVGIAMGLGGTDVAIEVADVALMADDLSKLPFALRLGRATLANIRANVAIALGLKIAFVLLAVTGFATLWMAIAADTGASLLVTANGLRLLRFGRSAA